MLELVSPAGELAMWLVMIALNSSSLSEDMTREHRQAQIYLFGALCTIHMLLLTASWLPHIILNSTILYGTFVYNFWYRSNRGDDGPVL